MPRTAVPPKSDPQIVIAVVDDDPLICEGLKETLESHGWTAVAYGSSEDFMADFLPGRLSCLLLDAKLPGTGGTDLLAQLRRDGHRFPVIMITGTSDIKTAVAALKAGADDFIEKPVAGPDLILAVARCLGQGRDSGAGTSARAAAAARISNLTRRQHQILALVLAGHPSKNIAADLGLSQRTVENHRAKIMKKTGCGSLPELARLALTATWSPEADRAAPPPEPALPPVLPAGQLGDDQFRRFFDAVPMAIVIGAIAVPEVIVYANPSFETLSGQTFAGIEGKSWPSLPGTSQTGPHRSLGQAIMDASDWVGTFELARTEGDGITVDAYASVIAGDDDQPAFRLAALVVVGGDNDRDELEEKIRERDAIILEIQHRVKNNLQMITSLIRIEARSNDNKKVKVPLDRLEGRINSIQIIYRLLSELSQTDEIDLGVYLSEIASAVMHSHAVEGIRLDLKADSCPVSVNVALPLGLVANELLTNALKYAFAGRDGGTITLHSLSDANGCQVVIADDGVGLPEGAVWPKPGKMGELIVRSLRKNARADLQVVSAPGKGTSVTIAFSRVASAPDFRA